MAGSAFMPNTATPTTAQTYNELMQYGIPGLPGQNVTNTIGPQVNPNLNMGTGLGSAFGGLFDPNSSAWGTQGMWGTLGSLGLGLGSYLNAQKMNNKNIEWGDAAERRKQQNHEDYQQFRDSWASAFA